MCVYEYMHDYIYMYVYKQCVYTYTHKNVFLFLITRHSVFIFSLNIIVLKMCKKYILDPSLSSVYFSQFHTLIIIHKV